MFKRRWMWEKRKIGRTEDIGTREKEREREKQERENDRRLFLARLRTIPAIRGFWWRRDESAGDDYFVAHRDWIRVEECSTWCGQASLARTGDRRFGLSSDASFQYRLQRCSDQQTVTAITAIDTLLPVVFAQRRLCPSRGQTLNCFIIVSSHVIRSFTDRDYFIFERRVDKKKKTRKKIVMNNNMRKYYNDFCCPIA